MVIVLLRAPIVPPDKNDKLILISKSSISHLLIDLQPSIISLIVYSLMRVLSQYTQTQDILLIINKYFDQIPMLVS